MWDAKVSLLTKNMKTYILIFNSRKKLFEINMCGNDIALYCLYIHSMQLILYRLFWYANVIMQIYKPLKFIVNSQDTERTLSQITHSSKFIINYNTNHCGIKKHLCVELLVELQIKILQHYY